MDGEELNINVQNEEKPLSGRAKRKARKARWKQQKKAKRAALKAEYRDAPWLKRIFRLYVRKPLAWILIIAILLGAGAFSFISSGAFAKALGEYLEEKAKEPVDSETILAESPIDDEGAARIEALPDYGADDTWTICVYIVGANLEDSNENDLSSVTNYLTSSIKADNERASANEEYEMVANFVDEVDGKGMSLPNYLYYVEKPVAYSKTLTEDVVVSSTPGCASTDIDEMRAAELPENVSIVIQTGGATRWSNGLINPNKTQRFEIKNGRFNEICNLPLQDSCSVETLAEFLKFCDSEYPADHRILLFWDHGGGAFGFGGDSIFGTGMTLGDIREALGMVCRPNANNPHYELIGFDACLMASLEVAHTLDGYGKYLAASEEVEPGDGWDHTTWLNGFGKDTSMNGADIARLIADSYIEYYIRQNINVGDFYGNCSVTFSAIDIAKAEKAYKAYESFAAAALKAAIEDQGVLATVGRAAARSARYAGSSYRVYNTIDLGMFMDNIVEYFPEESSAVRDAMREAVLYHRESGYLSDSTGLTVYMPVQVEGVGGVRLFLKYINQVSGSSDINALYYYKLAGCLNDELSDYAVSQGYGEAKNLDLSEIGTLQSIKPEINGSSFSVAVSPMENLIQTYQMSVVMYDRDKEVLRYLGNDNYAYLDGEGNLVSDFEGEWVTFGGEPLALEIVDDTSSYIKYRARVLHNGADSYMLVSYDKDQEEFSILGVKEITVSGAADVIDRSISELSVGDKIIPVYKTDDIKKGTSENLPGEKTIRFTSKTAVEMKPLEKGTYLATFAVTDPRGDEYYSNPVEYTVEGGKITALSINDEFTVIASNA